MDNNQVFLLLFLQNILNFLSFYFFVNKYSRILNDMNIHFEKTTRLFLDYLSDMYEYGNNYWRTSSSYDEDVESEYDEDEESEYDEDESETEEDVQEDEKEDLCSSYCPVSTNTSEELFAQNCN